VEVADEVVAQSFFIQYVDPTSAGGTLYEDGENCLYVYLSGDEDSATVYTVGASKDDYEGYMEGDLDEGQIDEDDNGDKNDEDLVPDEATATGDEPPELARDPEAVMVEHVEFVQEEATEYSIEYLVEADWEDVFAHYQDELEANRDVDDWQKATSGEDVGACSSLIMEMNTV